MFENVSIEMIISGCIIIFSFIYLYVTGQKDKIRLKVLELVEEAEKTFGDSTDSNIIKHNYVVAEINKYIPKRIKPFITDALIDRFIEDSLYILKDSLDDGKLNNSYQKEE